MKTEEINKWNERYAILREEMGMFKAIPILLEEYDAARSLPALSDGEVEEMVREYSDKLTIYRRDYYKGQHVGNAPTSKECSAQIQGYEEGIRAALSPKPDKEGCTCKDYNWINSTEDGGDMYCTKCSKPVNREEYAKIFPHLKSKQ